MNRRGIATQTVLAVNNDRQLEYYSTEPSTAKDHPYLIAVSLPQTLGIYNEKCSQIHSNELPVTYILAVHKKTYIKLDI